jgi:hypothetical protein
LTRPLIAGLLARRPARPVRLSVTHELVAGAREPPIWLAVWSAGVTVRAAPNRVFWRVGIPGDQPGPDPASFGYAAMNDVAGQDGQPVLGGRCPGR